MATMQVKGQRALASTRPVSNHRVVPFKPVSRSCNRAATVVRAVEAPDAEGDLDFSFSLSDAKKNNEYTDSEVQQALRYVQDGEGSQPIWDSDFVRNPYGLEDASFFDDIDNNEAYDADEYVIAGIPEAAPKKRGRGRREGAAADDGDDLEQAKALDKVKALEDRMVLEAALEEEFGDASRSEGAADSAPSKLAVWDWLTDFSSDSALTEDTQDLAETRQATMRRSTVTLVGEGEVAGDIARAKPELFENTEVQAYLELFANDDLSEDVLAAANAADAESDDMPASSITDEELARLDQLISEPLPIVDISDDSDVSLPRLDDSPELDKAVVDQYVESLRAAAANQEAVSEEDVRAMFGSEPLTFEAAEEEDAASKQEAEKLLAAAEPNIQPLNVDIESYAAQVEDISGEPAEDDDGGLGRELQSLAAIEDFTEQDVPSDEMIKALEAYVEAAEDYVAKEEERKAAVAKAVAGGELSVDELAEELEEVTDATDELLADANAFDDEDDDGVMAYDEEDDKENWVERIIELTRVTKVVKGGKIMGFRCVAIVGNQNGLVGVGCQAGREVAVAVKRTLVDAKKNIVRVPLVGAGTIPHRSEAKYHAARCVVLPASDGTGCIAGGSVRSVLELAGVKNCLAKRIGSRSALNSARATVKALQQLQSLNEVSRSRGVPMEQLLLQ